jgi:aryl-alcohol dehydrogenase-like predicted oxidoreductase
LNDAEVQHLQIPFNLLDHRWLEAGVDRLAMQRPGVTIHARSILLQGILASDADTWPAVSGIDPAGLLQRLDELARQCGRVSRADLCLAFVRAARWIQGFVMGVETMTQLNDLLRLFQQPVLTEAERVCVSNSLPLLPETLLNPALWPPMPTA